jgi:hypothetical protein
MFDTMPTMKIEVIDGVSWMAEDDARWYLTRVTGDSRAWSTHRGTQVRILPDRKLANYQDFVRVLMQLPQK